MRIIIVSSSPTTSERLIGETLDCRSQELLIKQSVRKLVRSGKQLKLAESALHRAPSCFALERGLLYRHSQLICHE